MLDPISLFVRLFRPFNPYAPISHVTLLDAGGRVLSTDDQASTPDSPLDRHALCEAGIMYAYPEKRLAAPPFADGCRYHVVWNTPDGRTFVARNANAPVMPPRPDDADGPIGCACRDEEGWVRFGSAQAELGPWCPPLFRENDTAPYRPDSFAGYGPCTARPCPGLLTEWHPGFVVPHKGQSFGLAPERVLEMKALDRLDEELRDIMHIHRSDVRRIPSPNEDPDALREDWGFYVAEYQLERGDINARLIGRDFWETVKESEPLLFTRMLNNGYFGCGLVGAWFDDPVRDFAHVQLFLQHGMPVFYEWTSDLESFRGADVLRPRSRSLFVAGAGPSAPPGLPTPRPLQGRYTNVNPVREAVASEASSKRRLADRITSPPTSPLLARQTRATPPLASRIDPSPTARAQAVAASTAYFPSGRLTERSALTCTRVPHEFGETHTTARVARLLCEFNANGVVDEGALRVWIHGIGKAVILAKQAFRNGRLRVPADLVKLARDYNLAFNTAVRVDSPAPWSSASAGLHDVSPRLRVGNRMAWRAAYDTWAAACADILRRPHAQRAAILQGGLVARIAKDFATSGDITSIPTEQVRLYGCPEPLLVGGKAYHDDWLADDELAALLGRDTDATPGTPRSMFPPPAIWFEYAGGIWTEAHERWYDGHRTELATGGGGASFYTTHRWHARLRNWRRTFDDAVVEIVDTDG